MFKLYSISHPTFTYLIVKITIVLDNVFHTEY